MNGSHTLLGVLPGNRLLWASIAALVAIAFVVVLLAGASKGGRSGTGQTSTFDGAEVPGGIVAPGFTLTDQSGRAVSLASYRGRIAVVAFLPAGTPHGPGPACRVCLLVAQQVRGALDELGPSTRARAIFVSGDVPKGVANRVLGQAALAGRAAYLSGSPFYLGKLWRAYRVDLPSSNVPKAEAATTVLLIDAHGHERVAYGIEQLTPEALSHDIRLLEAESDTS